jgi:hypothetical protein
MLVELPVDPEGVSAGGSAADGAAVGVGEGTVTLDSGDLSIDSAGSGVGEEVVDSPDDAVGDVVVVSGSVDSADWIAESGCPSTLVAMASTDEAVNDFVGSSTVETEHAAAIRANPTIKMIIRATRSIFRR